MFDFKFRDFVFEIFPEILFFLFDILFPRGAGVILFFCGYGASFSLDLSRYPRTDFSNGFSMLFGPVFGKPRGDSFLNGGRAGFSPPMGPKGVLTFHFYIVDYYFFHSLYITLLHILIYILLICMN